MSVIYSHRRNKAAGQIGDRKMKTVTMYQIRSYTNNEYSKPLSSKLRSSAAATKLVKRLKKMGVSAFKSPIKIAA